MDISTHTTLLCQACSAVLTGKQTKYCSLKCKNSYQPNIHYKYQKNRSLERKEKLIKLKGGCCELCGYNKSLRALCFHHLEKKSFRLDARSLAGTSWEKILEEVNKCQLLCCNCHMEVHEQLALQKLSA